MTINTFRSCFLAALVLAGTAALAIPGAEAQRLFGRDAVGMTEEESAAINGAIRTALEDYSKNGEYTWEAGARAGRVVTLNTFDRDGMRCAEVMHTFTKGEGRSYRAPFCQVPSGEWKLAF